MVIVVRAWLFLLLALLVLSVGVSVFCQERETAVGSIGCRCLLARSTARNRLTHTVRLGKQEVHEFVGEEAADVLR